MHKKSFLTYDGWPSTDSAADRLGYLHAPAVKREHEYRDKETEFHTNDAESENDRVKSKNRHRYGYLHITSLDMDE